jgi:YgiT-type zinc finger domain-containing protein
MDEETFYPCPECQVGALRPRRASYLTTLDGQLVCVPDFPAWVCDICGRREYDPASLAELQAMLANDRRSRRQRGPRLSTGEQTHPPMTRKPHPRP